MLCAWSLLLVPEGLKLVEDYKCSIQGRSWFLFFSSQLPPSPVECLLVRARGKSLQTAPVGVGTRDRAVEGTTREVPLLRNPK